MAPLTKSERATRAVNEAYLRQTQRLAPRPDCVSPCSKHPEWRVEVTAGQIAPPHAGLCPHCRDEVLERRNPDVAPVRRHDPGSAGAEKDLRYELWKTKHPSGQIESGSFEEHDALQAIAEARYEEESREAERSDPQSQGNLVSARVENGRWTEYWKPRGSRQIVKVVR